MSKQLKFDEAAGVFSRLRSEGKTIVQCHGTFDLVHPGHIIHFEEARALGDVLVVTITADRHVNKGPGRPYFGDRLRVKMLSALQAVDYVVVVPHPAAVEAIECVRPHIYCKGKEYANPDVDVTGNIRNDVATVEALGGQIRYVGSEVYSSTRLLNAHFDPYAPDVKAFCRPLAREFSPSQFRKVVDGFSGLRVVIVGEIILDRYTTVVVQGLTSKNRMLSGRFISDETQAGGALAVLRHLREFTSHVKLVSMVGAEPWVEPLLRQYLLPHEDCVMRQPSYTTIVKQRYVEPFAEGKELSKLFSVNFLDTGSLPADAEAAFREEVAEQLKECDVLLVMDFGHGLMGQSIRDLVQDSERFLALNCQTNSNNHGFNIINRQYRRADSFSLDEAEIRLAAARRSLDFPRALRALRAELSSKYAWLTRGAVMTLGLTESGDSAECPPLERQIVDNIGAGDAFCSLAAMAAFQKLPVAMGTFLGQLAGAQAVKIVGNREAIRKDRLVQAGMAMLSY